MKPWHVVALAGTVLCLLVFGNDAYASGGQVVIVNGTSNHCLPYPSCYQPYEIDIAPGSTVTWMNGDNRTHTATAGTPNGGPVGMFDSGPILAGHSYTQFFGTVGKYPYYDRTDMWPSGIVVVSNQRTTNAEIGWVNGSLSLTSTAANNGQVLVMTKQIENTGGTDATSVLFRLRILNGSGFLFYDKVVNGTVPAKNSAPVSFTWDTPPPGNYRLNFDAENLARQANENSEFSSDLISVSKTNSSQIQSIVTPSYVMNGAGAAVPEFGNTSILVLLVSLGLVAVYSTRAGLVSGSRLSS